MHSVLEDIPSAVLFERVADTNITRQIRRNIFERSWHPIFEMHAQIELALLSSVKNLRGWQPEAWKLIGDVWMRRQ
jgi:hypothetical protein